MKNFSDLNIVTDRFTGKKIEMDEILDTQIEVLDYRIEPSKYSDRGNGMRLTLQIRHQERERVSFTGSKILQEQCEKVQEIGGFPFRGIIVAIKPKGFKFI